MKVEIKVCNTKHFFNKPKSVRKDLRQIGHERNILRKLMNFRREQKNFHWELNNVYKGHKQAKIYNFEEKMDKLEVIVSLLKASDDWMEVIEVSLKVIIY